MTAALHHDDVALLARVAEGDESGFELLYIRYVTACRARARRVLAADDWVDDVVQLVFLNVWRHAARFNPTAASGSARGWLLALTHHKSVDVVREQQQHRVRREDEQLLAEHVAPGAGPEEVALRSNEARLHAAVHQCPSLATETVSLCFLEGLSQKEVAARLDLPLGTVKTRSRRGVRELRRLVDRTMLP